VALVPFLEEPALQQVALFHFFWCAFIDVVLGELRGGPVCEDYLGALGVTKVSCDDDAIRVQVEHLAQLCLVFLGVVLHDE